LFKLIKSISKKLLTNRIKNYFLRKVNKIKSLDFKNSWLIESFKSKKSNFDDIL